MNKLDLIKEIVNLTSKHGLKKAIHIVFKKFLTKSLLKMGRLFAFGPVSWLTGKVIDKILDEMLSLIEDWVAYQIIIVHKKEDFGNLRKAFEKRDELEKKEVITDVEYEHMDQEIRDAAYDAFTIGRVR